MVWQWQEMYLPKSVASPQGIALLLPKRNLLTEFWAKYFFRLFFIFFLLFYKDWKNDENEVVNNDDEYDPNNDDA